MNRVNSQPVWIPPLAGVATLFALFASSIAVRRSPFAATGRPVMVTLSTIAAVVIALYGALMIVQARARGIGSAVAGGIMLILGLFTTSHVRR